MIRHTAIPISSEELGFLFSEATVNDSLSFERNLKNYLGVKAVIALDSGRSAIALALRLLKVRMGEQILLPGFVCPILYDVVVSAGLKPVPVDVSLEDYNIDVADIAKADDPHVIVPVHLFGKSYNLSEVSSFAEKNGLVVVEDAAQAFGLQLGGKKAGSLGDVAILSFGFGKIITGGSGGALVINRDDLIQEASDAVYETIAPPSLSRRRIAVNITMMKLFETPRIYSMMRNHASNNREKAALEIVEHTLLSWNAPDATRYVPRRIDPLTAKIANHQLERVDSFNRKRIHNAEILSDILADQSVASIPSKEYFKDNVFCRFPVRLHRNHVRKREMIVKELLRRGIESEKPYCVLKELPCILESMPNSSELADALFTVPNHPCLSDREVVSIGETVLSLLRSIS
jgi:dTDP-4-amino-4,6-dideoxygalactose transaminase